MKTHLPKVKVDERKWHVIDADGAVLGRLAVQVADILRGKNKPVYTPHLDAGDFVVVINAEKVRLTGKKETDKEYMTYSGWKGGEKYATVEAIRAKHPVIRESRTVNEFLDFDGRTDHFQIPLSSAEAGTQLIRQMRALADAECR